MLCSCTISLIIRHPYPTSRRFRFNLRILPDSQTFDSDSGFRILIPPMRQARLRRTRPPRVFTRWWLLSVSLGNVIVLSYDPTCFPYAIPYAFLMFLSLPYYEAVCYFVTILPSRIPYDSDSYLAQVRSWLTVPDFVELSGLSINSFVLCIISSVW